MKGIYRIFERYEVEKRILHCTILLGLFYLAMALTPVFKLFVVMIAFLISQGILWHYKLCKAHRPKNL